MVGSTALKKGFFIPAFLNTEPPQPFRTLTIAEQSMKVKKMLMRIFRDSRKVAGSQPGIDEYDFVEDLSSWEFVIPSDDDDDHEAYYSPNDKDLEVFVDGDDVEIGIEPEAVVGETVLKQDYFCLHGSPYPDVSTGSPSPAQIAVALDVAPVGLNDYKNDHGYVPDYDINQEEEDYDEDDFDLDEESFPYCVRNKVAKERMKELSKMTCQRMSKPKSSPYYCNRPGATVKIIKSRSD
ncbi:PREDICTED: uncharacterized protein LOC109161863 isoform X2 [Ipomoea nil]|uniref:uncharacterized protein LOC109161863 isoform X2 n=1 Tax=Ipomoea nil TaxID=35883 RepID=UPI00090107B2|nr:PREDICTED: uncharacterized protein LOC109161863 isoform X2 [Ipomoea nil]